jgi:hypothetical protein
MRDLLIGGLAMLSLIVHGLSRFTPASSGIELMPIFVPASLQVERERRAERGQPAGRGGMEAAELARVLLDTPLSPEVAARLAPEIQGLKATRLRLLDARERRHHLNVALMRAGVRLGKLLTPEQWAWIQGSRDGVRAQSEAELFSRLEAQLTGQSAPR